VPAWRGNADATAALMRCSAPAFRLCSAAVAAFEVDVDVNNSQCVDQQLAKAHQTDYDRPNPV